MGEFYATKSKLQGMGDNIDRRFADVSTMDSRLRIQVWADDTNCQLLRHDVAVR